MAVTTKHDKDLSNKILIMPNITFYGALMALLTLADEREMQRLQSAFPPSTMIQHISDHENAVLDMIFQINDVTFNAVLLALVQLADTDNFAKFERLFPDAVMEAKIRYHAPGACVSAKEWLEVYPEEADGVDAGMLDSLFANARAKAGA